MNKFRERLIHLHHCRGIGWKSIFQILQHDPTLSSIYITPSSYYERILPLSNNQMNNFLKDLHSLPIQSMLKQYRNSNVGIITIFDQEYPRILKEIYDPPWVIYTAGDHALLNSEKLLSVVGSRTPSATSRQSMTKILTPLIKQKWVLVSGLARGIDTMAHQLAIYHNGKTIAVIAGGLHHIYPQENKELATSIKENHLIISEYPPNTRPEKWQFPMRNRIISGLAQGTLVVEAKERSGSLITADQALNQGREVFAIPGSILELSCVGTNKLIQSGAKLVLTSDDILSEIHVGTKNK